MWRHDTQHNDIQPKDIFVPGVIYAKCRKKALVLRLIMLTVIMLSVFMLSVVLSLTALSLTTFRIITLSITITWCFNQHNRKNTWCKYKCVVYAVSFKAVMLSFIMLSVMALKIRVYFAFSIIVENFLNALFHSIFISAVTHLSLKNQ